LSANLFAAREAIENQASGLVALLDKVNATRRARVAEGKRAKVSAPGRMAPLKHWCARRAAVEARAAGAIGFTD
jgi:hypothetical protein